MRPNGRSREVEAAIAAIAAQQHGMLTRAQLLAAGLTRDAIVHRVQTSRLRVVHRGVYLAGPVALPHSAAMAATLACARSVLGVRSAGALWQLLRTGTSGSVELIIPPESRCHRPGIRTLRTGPLARDEVTVFASIPVTTPARTLYDLATRVTPRELERALAEALARRLATRAEFEELLARYRGSAATRRLRELIDCDTPPALTRSEAEEVFLALVRQAQLPSPHVNVLVCGYEVDFHWPAERFVVEIDGFAAHGTRRRFEHDRRRDAVLAAAGVRVMRVTWRQLEQEQFALLVRLAQALTLARAGA